MKASFNSFKAYFFVDVLARNAFCVLLTLALIPKVSAQQIPDGYESYNSRPNVLSLPAIPASLGKDWEVLRKAHFGFIAELLELYSTDTHFYFLARDAEYLYDAAQLITQNTEDSKRIHLINVSRANMKNPNIKAYLKEHDISDETLASGKKIVLVDTGFSGTIPRVIDQLFLKENKGKIKTHLLVSSNADHPSSRGFLININASANEQNPANMHGTIVSYEHIPRYTDRSTLFALVQNNLHPISPTNNSATDGVVSKTVAIQYMQDLKAFYEAPSTKELIQTIRNEVRDLKHLLTDGTEKSKELIKQKLQKDDNSKHIKIYEALARDIVESQFNAQLDLKITLEDLSLKKTYDAPSALGSKKNQLIKKYPEWTPVLEDPVTQIKKLFIDNNWQMIGNLIDADVDNEINRIIIKSLYDNNATGIKKKYQILMIEKGSKATLVDVVSHHGILTPDLTKLIIERNEPHALQLLAVRIFSNPNSIHMRDLIKLTIEKGDQSVLRALAVHTFSQPYTANMTDLLQILIEKADSAVLNDIAYRVFSQSHAINMNDLVKLLIEKSDDSIALDNLNGYALRTNHASKWPDYSLFVKACKIPNRQERIQFLNQHQSVSNCINFLN